MDNDTKLPYILNQVQGRLVTVDMQYCYMFDDMTMHATNHQIHVMIPLEVEALQQSYIEHHLTHAMNQQVKSKEEFARRRRDLETVFEVVQALRLSEIDRQELTLDDLLESGRMTLMVQQVRIRPTPLDATYLYSLDKNEGTVNDVRLHQLEAAPQYRKIDDWKIGAAPAASSD